MGLFIATLSVRHYPTTHNHTNRRRALAAPLRPACTKDREHSRPNDFFSSKRTTTTTTRLFLPSLAIPLSLYPSGVRACSHLGRFIGLYHSLSLSPSVTAPLTRSLALPLSGRRRVRALLPLVRVTIRAAATNTRWFARSLTAVGFGVFTHRKIPCTDNQLIDKRSQHWRRRSCVRTTSHRLHRHLAVRCCALILVPAAYAYAFRYMRVCPRKISTFTAAFICTIGAPLGRRCPDYKNYFVNNFISDITYRVYPYSNII